MHVCVDMTQMPLWQSKLSMHFWPLAHALQTAPPQSTSVS